MILIKHQTSEMNDFRHTVTAEATKRHCAVNELTATALQLCISCHWLIYVVLLPANRFLKEPSDLPGHFTVTQVIEMFEKTRLVSS